MRFIVAIITVAVGYGFAWMVDFEPLALPFVILAGITLYERESFQ